MRKSIPNGVAVAFALWLAVLLAPLAGHAQGGIQQSGPVTAGHVPTWFGNGILGDGGTAKNGVITNVGVVNSGFGICQNSGPITASYAEICLGFVSGQPTISVGGSASPATLSLNIGGNTFTLPGSASCLGCGSMAGQNSNAIAVTGGSATGLSALGVGAAQADSVGQVLSTSATIANPTTLATVFDPVRVTIGSFAAAQEFGPPIAQGSANAIVGASILPSNANSATTMLGQGVAGYGFTLSPGSTGIYGESVGVSGTGGMGVNGGAAWGLTAVSSNCFATNCTANSGFQGGTNTALVTGLEISTQVEKTSAALAPTNIRAVSLLIDGASVSRPTFGTGSSTYLGIDVERNNVAMTGTCSGANTEPQCFDVAIRTGDGASYVGLSLGAAGTAANNVNGQIFSMTAYNSSGSGILASEFFNYLGVLTLSVPASGQFVFGINGVVAETISTSGVSVVGGLSATGSVVASQGVSVGAGLVALSTGDIVPGATASTTVLPTSATGPFGYITLMNGLPAATPFLYSAAHSGLTYDVVDNKLCVYAGVAGWKCVVLS